MSIDEAIEHTCEVAEGCPAEDRQCAYQHDELADWLEELKAYKEIGLTPEEIHKLISIDRWNDAVEKEWLKCLQAEKDGLMVKLPCKIGDLLYEVDLPEYSVITCKVLSVLHYCGPEHHIPGNKIVSAVDVKVEVIEGHGKGSSYDFSQEDFGETVFLAREAAEAALKEQEG